MLWVPGKAPLQVQHNMDGNSPGVVVTTAGSAGTKGAVTELIASLDFDAYWLTVLASGYALSASQARGCLDILVGAATEEVLIENLLMGYAANRGSKRWDFPLYLPAGTRIAAQVAGDLLNETVAIGVMLYGGQGYPPFPVGTRVITYGVSSVPAGTGITPGASGAEGSWTEVTASASRRHLALVPSFQLEGDTTTNNRWIEVDVGAGAATEEELMGGFSFATTSTEEMHGPAQSFPIFHEVAAGTRLVMRASNEGANDGGYGCALHGVS